MDLEQAFIHNMKKYRKMRGISQERLAELCGASSSHIRQIECGAKTPSFNFIGKLAEGLAVPPALLFSHAGIEDNYLESDARGIEAELIENLTRAIHDAFAQMRDR